LIGYFGNTNSDGYIKCTSNGSIITCSKLDAPTETNKTCIKAGDLLYVDGRNVKLCLDTTKENAIEIFKEDTANYFLQGNILNTSLSNNKFYIIGLSENAVITLTGKKINEYLSISIISNILYIIHHKYTSIDINIYI